LSFSKQCCSKLHCGGPYTMAMWCCLVAYWTLSCFSPLFF
jgi:hypothetical protein